MQKHPKRIKEDEELGNFARKLTQAMLTVSSDCGLITQTGPCEKELKQ